MCVLHPAELGLGSIADPHGPRYFSFVGDPRGLPFFGGWSCLCVHCCTQDWLDVQRGYTIALWEGTLITSYSYPREVRSEAWLNWHQLRKVVYWKLPHYQCVVYSACVMGIIFSALLLLYIGPSKNHDKNYRSLNLVRAYLGIWAKKLISSYHIEICMCMYSLTPPLLRSGGVRYSS